MKGEIKTETHFAYYRYDFEKDSLVAVFDIVRYLEDEYGNVEIITQSYFEQEECGSMKEIFKEFNNIC